MNDLKLLADKIFPNVSSDISVWETKYPERKENGECVTRFAPSPTGYMHIGGLYISLINENIARQKNGTFYLRIEDTDQNRILENGVSEIINTLDNYDIHFDEGPISEHEDQGNYAPYRQSQRKEIYQSYAKYLIENGLAYPCFCTKEEIEDIREKQTLENSSIVGYGEKYAKCRNLIASEAIKNIEEGKEFVIRFKVPETENKRILVEDIVRGKIEMDNNNIDIVIIKGDGLPTYHFAHVIDDHLMRTTHVIRGEEWISSLPQHIQMFRALGFKVPKYAHVCSILKQDGSSKRKISKRKDPEARVGFYYEEGYSVVAVKEYLLNLINSRFELWRNQNPNKSYKEFDIKLSDMNSSGALFDFDKLANVSKKIIKNMTDQEVFDLSSNWAKEFCPKLSENISQNPEKYFSSIEIWHKNRMDIAKWNEIEKQFAYLYDKDFAKTITLNELDSLPSVKEILQEYKNSYDENDDQQTWFEKLKTIAEKYGYCPDMKKYKENPEAFNGSMVHVSSFIRVALTDKKDSPDIYKIQQFLGKDEVLKRLQNACEKL